MSAELSIVVLPSSDRLREGRTDYTTPDHKDRLLSSITGFFRENVKLHGKTVDEKLHILIKYITKLAGAGSGYISSTAHVDERFIGDTCRAAYISDSSSHRTSVNKVVDMFFPVNYEMLHFQAGDKRNIVICNNKEFLKKHQCPAIKIQSMLYIPIINDNEQIGIVALANRKNGFTKRLIEYIQPMIDIVSSIKDFRQFVDRSIVEERQVMLDKATNINNIVMAILRNSREITIIMDPKYNIMLTSYAGYDYFSLIFDNIKLHQGVNFMETLIKYKNMEFNILKKMILDARNGKVPSRVIKFTYSNEIVYLDITVSPVKIDGEIRSICLMGKDISDDVDTRRQLEDAKQEACDALQSKDEYLSRISHELRTPLNSIRGFAQLLDVNINNNKNCNIETEFTAKILKYVKYIVKGSNHLLKLINEVLDIASLDSGKLSLSMEPVSVKRAVMTVVNMLKPLSDKREISIEIKNSLSYNVLADSHRLQQVLVNVVSNAIKYNKQGGIIKILRESETTNYIKDNVTKSINYELIIIEDTGLGIPQNRINELFVPFQRLGAEQTDIDGTGLGLAYSKKLMERMNGDILISSVEGVGTTVTLKCQKAVNTKISSPSRRRPSSISKSREVTKSSKILYIEDNYDNLELMKAIASDYLLSELLTATNGESGILMASSHKPNLIIVDLGLPDITGELVIQRIKADENLRDIPIIVYSADMSVKRKKFVLENGANEFISKPPDMEHLIKSIMKYIK